MSVALEADRETRGDESQALEEIRQLFARYRQIARHGVVADHAEPTEAGARKRTARRWHLSADAEVQGAADALTHVRLLTARRREWRRISASSWSTSGTLALLAEATGRAGINVESGCGVTSDDPGIIHLLVEDAAAGRWRRLAWRCARARRVRHRPRGRSGRAVSSRERAARAAPSQCQALGGRSDEIPAVGFAAAHCAPTTVVSPRTGSTLIGRPGSIGSESGRQCRWSVSNRVASNANAVSAVESVQVGARTEARSSVRLQAGLGGVDVAPVLVGGRLSPPPSASGLTLSAPGRSLTLKRAAVVLDP